MAHNYADNLFITSFTPKEPQVALCQAAANSNIIVSFINQSGKRFITTQSIENFINNGEEKQALYVVETKKEVSSHANLIKRLTCYSVLNTTEDVNVTGKQIVVATVEVALKLLENNQLNFENIGLFILFNCQKVLRDPLTQKLTVWLNRRTGTSKVLGISGSLLHSLEKPFAVETEVSAVEKRLRCVLNTESDCVTILHQCARPNDFIIEYTEGGKPSDAETLVIINQVESEIANAKEFLMDHHFEVFDYEGREFDYLEIPDPTVEPLELLDKFLYVLNNYGLYPADVSAYVILKQIEILIIRTPFERHYLLLGVVLTVFVKIRAIFDSFFEPFSKKKLLYTYCSPKVLKLFDVIRQFRQTTEKFYPPQLPVANSEETELSAQKINCQENTAVNNDLNDSKKNNTLNQCSKPIKLENQSTDTTRSKTEVVGEEEGASQKQKEEINKPGPRRNRSEWMRGKRSSEMLKPHEIDPHTMCGLVLVDDDVIAQVVFYLFSVLKAADEDFSFLRVQFTVAISGNLVEGALEKAYKRQELVLRHFRIRECNLLISTSFIECGIDLPRCNLVVRLDPLANFRSYALGKARARGVDALHILMTSERDMQQRTKQLASYHAIEQIMSKSKTGDDIKSDDEEADKYACMLKSFRPSFQKDAPYVDLNSALALLNRYCAKLPSDTFTRLTPQWNIVALPSSEQTLYTCVIRLPINSPIKKSIIGPAMPSVVLACRFAALETCLALHSTGEIDDSLMPITKETFWQRTENSTASSEEDSFEDEGMIRPGTTKRRQYYNKRIADCLTDCRPMPGVPCYLYHISMTLTCPLPEEQNTRGRKIFSPESSPRGFGILTARPISDVGLFPIFTRAGEVAIELKLSSERVTLIDEQINKIVPFINFTFTNVLRLQKYLMMFDPDTSENSYFIVPTHKDGDEGHVRVDWHFLDLIYHAQNCPTWISDQDRNNYNFSINDYEDSVVCPWYRNQDQPQYFYVAEICSYLSPQSAFPGADYPTFEAYYLHKYGIQIQNGAQALLDVDHTSARLNFLTPRYVNRKGVALPTTSEAKKRAKRENLGQKQILVPELCNIHPFPASLWQKAVCLPCILHRLNALLLSNQLRRLVAEELGLGNPGDPDTIWKPLDFGWNLADVLKKSRESVPKPVSPIKEESTADSSYQTDPGDTESESGGKLEIGTWSNDLAGDLMHEVTPMDTENWRYGSPTSWLREQSSGDELYDSQSDDGGSNSDDSDDTSLDDDDDDRGLRIQFKTRDVAEAIEPNRRIPSMEDVEEVEDVWTCSPDENDDAFIANKQKYDQLVLEYQERIEKEGVLCRHERNFQLPWLKNCAKIGNKGLNSDLTPSTTDNSQIHIVQDFKEVVEGLLYAPFIRQSLLKHRLKTEISKFRKESFEIKNAKNSETWGSITTHLGTSESEESENELFSFDNQPVLEDHPGPSPSLILQALTMSNANDGINLERLETIGDSFLKYAITTYLYCSYENVHEGKLSHLRSKQVSNLNLYRLGKNKVFAESMVATKFEPHDNWLPPCYFVPRELERALIAAGLPASLWNRADLPALHNMTREEIGKLVQERSQQKDKPDTSDDTQQSQCFLPYNLITQHSIPDKSIADCVEALIGAYLVDCGPRGALLFMSWLGIKVLPVEEKFSTSKGELLKNRLPGYLMPIKIEENSWKQTCFLELKAPKPPLLRLVADPEGELSRLLTGFDAFESELRYRFRDRCYLLQAVSHASYSHNQLTDCYQRLEFLGDAVLDYLITRYLFEDPRHHSPGSLTDLRSALVNNTMFASLAVRHGFHKFFRHQCPSLHDVIDRFVRIQQENNHAISDECFLVMDSDAEEAEDVEVPKALGDVFESIAGAIYLDSGMSLDAVWRVYYRIMKPEIETFSTHVPKSPIRELLELEPETAQFGKPEKLADGRRVRVSVEVFGKGIFKGIGRNYRIAKCTAAKCALKQLKHRGVLQNNKHLREEDDS